VPFHADVTKDDDIISMFTAAVEACGRVDALLNVAAVHGRRLGEFLSLEEYEAMTPLNLRGLLLSMKYGIETMLRTGGEATVNVSSAGSFNVEEREAAMYMATKAAMNALTKAVAVEYGRQGHPGQRPGAGLYPFGNDPQGATGGAHGYEQQGRPGSWRRTLGAGRSGRLSRL
jgi:NAD(P)-dependent dehydrogenase (short-subunit alcohol dehydrogenase family)